MYYCIEQQHILLEQFRQQQLDIPEQPQMDYPMAMVVVELMVRVEMYRQN